LEAETKLDVAEIVSSQLITLGHRRKQEFYIGGTAICKSVETAERFLCSYHESIPFRLVPMTRIDPYPPQPSQCHETSPRGAARDTAFARGHKLQYCRKELVNPYLGRNSAPSHLPTLPNDHVLVWFISGNACILDHTDNFHPFDNPSKHNVFIVEEGGCGASDEELAAVCVWTGVLSLFPQG
jgi:hypothetical protein